MWPANILILYCIAKYIHCSTWPFWDVHVHKSTNIKFSSWWLIIIKVTSPQYWPPLPRGWRQRPFWAAPERKPSLPSVCSAPRARATASCKQTEAASASSRLSPCPCEACRTLGPSSWCNCVRYLHLKHEQEKAYLNFPEINKFLFSFFYRIFMVQASVAILTFMQMRNRYWNNYQ